MRIRMSSASVTSEAGPTRRRLRDAAISVRMLRSPVSLQDLDRLGELGYFSLRDVDDGPAFLQGGNGPVFVLDLHAAVGVDVHHRRIHGPDVQLHGLDTGGCRRPN